MVWTYSCDGTSAKQRPKTRIVIMNARGLIVSAAESADGSAYSHRLHKLAEGLEANGVSCDFFHLPDHWPLGTVTTASIFFPFWIRTLRKYDFIHCGVEEAGQAIFFCRPFLRCVVIYDAHGDVVAQSALANAIRTSGRRPSASLRVRLFMLMALKAADHVLAVSKPQIQALISSGVAPGNISLIRNGVDLESFGPMPFHRPGRFVFAYVGEFQVWQGTDNLLEAFARVQDPCARLLVVGFRGEDSAIKQAFHNRLGSRVELVDRTDRRTMIGLLQTVAVLVIPRIAHPAIRHAFPTKFAEYAALGRPILVNDVDETADFVRTYRCGWVSQPSAEAMAEKMAEAMTCSHQTLVAMGRRARQMAEENFSWAKSAGEYAALIRDLTSGRHGSTG
jgi:glycosyltransferase involved in cell wall biosynthesis